MDRKIEKTRGYWLRRHWPWLVGGLLAVFLTGYLAFGNFTATLRVERAGIHIGEVKRTQFDDFVRMDGRVEPISVVLISPEEGGIVTEKVVEEGAHVRAGDVIVRLSNSNLDLQILNAEAELAEKQNILRNTQLSMEQDRLNNQNDKLQLDADVVRTQRAFQQLERLYDEQLVARESYLQAKEDYELTARKQHLVRQRLQKDSVYRLSQMEQLHDNLDNMRRNVVLIRQRREQLNVRSKITGELGFLDVELGQSILPGQKIGQINDLSDYKVQAKIDEHYIDRVRPGLLATFDREGVTYTLRVRKVYPEVREGMFRTDFVFEGKRPANIRSGQTYYLDLQLGRSQQCVVIPKGTFYSVTGGQWAFVLDKDGNRAYRRNIRIGRQNPLYYEVLEGLEPGEQVIVSGYEAYRDNEILVLK